jgi:hypothetical protein
MTSVARRNICHQATPDASSSGGEGGVGNRLLESARRWDKATIKLAPEYGGVEIRVIGGIATIS